MCSTAVLRAMNSLPKVEASTVFCRLLYQIMGALLRFLSMIDKFGNCPHGQHPQNSALRQDYPWDQACHEEWVRLRHDRSRASHAVRTDLDQWVGASDQRQGNVSLMFSSNQRYDITLSGVLLGALPCGLTSLQLQWQCHNVRAQQPIVECQ